MTDFSFFFHPADIKYSLKTLKKALFPGSPLFEHRKTVALPHCLPWKTVPTGTTHVPPRRALSALACGGTGLLSGHLCIVTFPKCRLSPWLFHQRPVSVAPLQLVSPALPANTSSDKPSLGKMPVLDPLSWQDPELVKTSNPGWNSQITRGQVLHFGGRLCFSLTLAGKEESLCFFNNIVVYARKGPCPLLSSL